MKRLTKSQYELVAGVLKDYIDDRNAAVNDGDPKFRLQSYQDLSLLTEIANELAHKFMYTDDQFKYKEFIADCGIEVWKKG